MKRSAVAKRYAQALFEAAKSKGTIDVVGNQLNRLHSTFTEVPQYRMILSAPQVSDDQKLALIEDNVEEGISSILEGFLRLLLRKDRIEHLGYIAELYQRLADENRGVVKAHVTTAIQIDEGMIDSLKNNLGMITGKKVDIVPKVDPEIIGGVVVVINNRIVDQSVRSLLKQVRDELMMVKIE